MSLKGLFWMFEWNNRWVSRIVRWVCVGIVIGAAAAAAVEVNMAYFGAKKQLFPVVSVGLIGNFKEEQKRERTIS